MQMIIPTTLQKKTRRRFEPRQEPPNTREKHIVVQVLYKRVELRFKVLSYQETVNLYPEEYLRKDLLGTRKVPQAIKERYRKRGFLCNGRHLFKKKDR